MNKIPIVFAINDGYTVQLAVVISSIIKNSKTTQSIEFNILNSDISDKNKETLLKLEELKDNIKINFIDMKQYTQPEILEKYLSVRKDYSYITVETYFRFFIPEIFPQYNKVLYLDADILVFDDIANLFNENIEEAYIGAVEDICIKGLVANERYKTSLFPNCSFAWYIQEKLKKQSQKYFNAGVLLMNLDKIRKDNKVEELWHFVAENSPLEFQDQDVLNAVFESKTKYLNNKWNVLHNTQKHAKRIKDKAEQKELLKTLKKPSLYHYNGGDAKPWQAQTKLTRYSYIKEWWSYFENTPFYAPRFQMLKGYHDLYMRQIRTDNIFCIKIFNFKLIEITKNEKVIKFEILNLLKFNIR